MANSPSCSSTSPSTSTATTVADLQEADALSDDSGVDVKPQCSRKPLERFLKFEPETSTESSSKRNKRKSSEPKKRKDVLLMKRFRWDSDDEDNVDNVDDVFDAIEGERPSSGDSGCQVATTPTTTNLSKATEEKKKRPRQWRKPKVEKDTTATVVKQETILQTFSRQSVIRKHDATSSTSTTLNSSHSSTNDLQALSPSCSSHCLTTGQICVPPVVKSSDYDGLVEGSEESSCGDPSGRTNRTVGRPRNYKSMSRQRRIEANARERTRVHTISAAFENLRRAVPAYAHNQKLSKLAILRIASAYIVALACLSEQDYSEEQSRSTLADCVEQCTRTIQAEGRSRRRTSKD